MADKPDEATDPGATVEGDASDPLSDTDHLVRLPASAGANIEDTRALVPADGTQPEIPRTTDTRALIPADGTQPEIPKTTATRAPVPADSTQPEPKTTRALVPSDSTQPEMPKTADTRALVPPDGTQPEIQDDGDTRISWAPIAPDTARVAGLSTDELAPDDDGEPAPEHTNPTVDPWPQPYQKRNAPEPWADVSERQPTEPQTTAREPTEPQPSDAGSITAKGVGEWAPESKTAPSHTEPAVIAEGAETEPVERTVRLDLSQQDELMRLRAQQDEVLRERFRKEVVVMFTDVAGSTAYYEKYGDLAGRQKMLTHNALLFPVIRAHSGTVIKTLGDSIMACFDNANQALAAAAEMQHSLAEFNDSVTNDDEAIHIRIGLNAGRAIPEQGDLHGDVVNVAARIEEHAQAGEILMADVVARQARDRPLVLVGPVALKGKRDPLILHRLKWKEETTGQGEQIKEPQLPDHLRSHFHLQGTVDRGPLGIVYLARDVRRDAPVAIKLLYQFVTQSAEARRYFRDQMWSNAQLHNPNIVRVLEFSASRDDRAYVVTEYVDGINLTQHVAQSGCPSMHELARIGYHVAAALEHAHEHGCIHGDVKPQNVLLDATGQVKITDFGLAGLWTDKPASDPMTSPAFMAPQTLAGPATDPRVDVYSLGALLYFLAVGRSPLDGGNDATVVTMRAVFSGRIRPLSQVDPDLPRELIAIVDKAMAPAASRRIQTMGDLKTRLAAFLETLGPQSEPPSHPAADAGKTRITQPAIKSETTRRTNVTAVVDAHRQQQRRPLLIGLGVIALIPLLIAAIVIASRVRGCSAMELPAPPGNTAPLADR